MRWTDDLELAIQAARAAGDIVMQHFRTELEVHYKSPDQPLTKADLAADKILKQLLLADRDYGWLSEETADTQDRLQKSTVWLVDPIDGTRSFISGRAEFSISIGLAQEGEAVLGVVFNPSTNEMFAGIRGGGATLNGSSISISTADRRPVMAASRSEIKRGDFDAFEETHDILPTGSTAYKLGKIADGSADTFVSRGPKSEWDLCGGTLIVEEAGGVVTDLAGNRLQYNRPNPHITGVIAARAELHGPLLERIRNLK